MRKTLLSLALGTSLMLCGNTASAGFFDKPTEEGFISNYASLVYDHYEETYKDALKLQKAINAFLSNPTEETMSDAKESWLKSRDSYGQTEVFRFYEGPIDFANENGNEGPEGRLNAWPLDEAYIDYVKGNPQAGLVNSPGFEINKESLKDKNQVDDEADVSTGYHAIEFLLWGQDLSLEGPGNRPVSDYTNTPENQRRRAYLKAVTDLLVEDLKFLVNEWEPDQENYAKKFQEDEKALAKVMTALATLSGFELASERMATALDSGDQEDEHSCFSDNTHKDFIANQRGIYNVYFSAGLYSYLKTKEHDLAEELEEHVLKTSKLIKKLPHPIDREILATPKSSESRAQMEEVVTALQEQANLFKKAGQKLGLDVQILN